MIKEILNKIDSDKHSIIALFKANGNNFLYHNNLIFNGSLLRAKA